MSNNCPFFETGENLNVQAKVKAFLNEQADFLSSASASSTRATGDAIQELLADQFNEMLGHWSTEYSSDFAARAMADLAFQEKNGFYVVVDVKTHRVSKDFSMPNLISVERLARFYENDQNVFAILLISYGIDGTKVTVNEVRFVPIEHLHWDCLTVGALGWGQIQIAKASFVKVDSSITRKAWMLELCDYLLDFYPKEQQKIAKRIARFEHVKEFWSKHA